jgi:hypothetical protein
MAKVDDLELTLMPLDYLRRFLGIDPYHFWQMTKDTNPIRGYSHIYPHERWQYNSMAMPGTDAKRGPSRQDLANAIADAEQKIASVSELDAWPAPTYTEDEMVILKMPKTDFASEWPSRSRPYGLMTRWKQVQRVGTLTLTLQDDAVDISAAYNATDDVTFTVTVQSGVTADEVVVMYPDTEVRIRPIEVSVSGTTATITIKKWLLGDPDDWETSDAIDADTTTDLLQTVDVYRRWIDSSDQILIAWEPDILICGCLETDTCAACQTATKAACAVEKDYRIGYVGWQFATWNATTEEYDRDTCAISRYPDRAIISYEHGFPSGDDYYISNRWMQTVSKLAVAQLPDYVVDTTSRPDALWYWMQDMTWVEGFNRHTMSQSDLNNPFGSKRGHVEAWKEVFRAIGD